MADKCARTRCENQTRPQGVRIDNNGGQPGRVYCPVCAEKILTYAKSCGTPMTNIVVIDGIDTTEPYL